MKVTETGLGKVIETDVLILGAGAAGSGLRLQPDARVRTWSSLTPLRYNSQHWNLR